jgi:glycosyltransferase involved in cell wall biosynthesis
MSNVSPVVEPFTRARVAGDTPLVEVMIPTLNESANIIEAVRNASQLGPVFVIDARSEDDTAALAQSAGATVMSYPGRGYASQKNWGLEKLPFRGKWIFILDADERITPALREEVCRVVASEPPVDGYLVNRLLLFMGRAVRHGGLYPSWNLRLFRRGRASYEDRSVHEHMICKGPVAYLRNEMLHVRRETISQYIQKHVHYAELESDEWVKWKLGRSKGARAGALFNDLLRLRQWLRREVWPRLPMRPMWRFLYMYLIRLGFLDGRAGWHLAWLMSNYEYMIGVLYEEKLAAIRQRRRARSPAAATPHLNAAKPRE